MSMREKETDRLAMVAQCRSCNGVNTARDGTSLVVLFKLTLKDVEDLFHAPTLAPEGGTCPG